MHHSQNPERRWDGWGYVNKMDSQPRGSQLLGSDSGPGYLTQNAISTGGSKIPIERNRGLGEELHRISWATIVGLNVPFFSMKARFCKLCNVQQLVR